MFRNTIGQPALACLVVYATGTVFSAAHAECRTVRGALEEMQVTGPACASPVSLCTVAHLVGHLKGDARFTAASVQPTADTPTTGVVFVTGDTTITDARLGGKRGTLLVKNAAAFRTVGDGDLADVQIIIGGTGDFAAASGSLRVSGNFVAGAGT